MKDYARHLGTAATGTRGVGRPRGRTSGSRARTTGATGAASSNTTGRQRQGRVLNAAQDMPATSNPADLTRNLVQAFGLFTETLAAAGIPWETASQIVADGYSLNR